MSDQLTSRRAGAADPELVGPSLVGCPGKYENAQTADLVAVACSNDTANPISGVRLHLFGAAAHWLSDWFARAAAVRQSDALA